MGRDVIIALDFANKEETLAFLDQFTDCKPFVKIGMELFYGEGPEVVREIKKRGHKIFLDLKLHDIPNTVKKAMKNLAKLGVDMTNCHAGGTIEMMKAAKQGLEEGSIDGHQTILLAVTQLTSTSQEQMEQDLWIDHSMQDTVTHYALNAQKAGLEGVVCSPLEAGFVKDACGKDFVTVTPGIRFSQDTKGDQVRITTPKQAKEIGSHYIVVGRPITSAADPQQAYKQCVKDFVGE